MLNPIPDIVLAIMGTTHARSFSFHRLAEVHFGATSSKAVPAALAAAGAARPLILISKSVRAGSSIDDLLEAVPGAMIVNAPSRHAPRDEILEIARSASGFDPDAVVAVGGGSAIDGAKATALALTARLRVADDFDAYLFSFEGGVRLVPELPAPSQMIIAVPTTLSGAEITGAFGMLDTRTGLKRGCLSPKYEPTTVVYDPALAAHTPSDLWNSSAARLIDHAVEGLISRWSGPLNAAFDTEALAIASQSLGGRTREDIDRSQQASLLAMYPLESARLGLSHAIGHIIGPRWGISHGATSALALPAVMEFVSDVAIAPLARVAAALAPFEDATPSNAIAAVRRIMDRLGQPLRLRDVGVDPADIPTAAADVMHDFGVAACPKPVTVADVEDMLRAAW